MRSRRETLVPEQQSLARVFSAWKTRLEQLTEFHTATEKTEVHEMKLATANADCNRCLGVQSSLVKELCLWIWLNEDQASLE